MHEDHLIDGIVDDLKLRLRAAGKSRVSHVILELSPDSHMDEMSVEMHLESHLSDEPALAGASIEFRHVPPRLFCSQCNSEFERQPGVFTCPQCARPGRPCGHRSGLRVIDVDLT